MRTVNASFSTAIAEGTVKVAELYELELADGTIYRYTSHSKDITWDLGNNIYSSIPIGRGPLQYSNNLESDTVQVGMANISGDLYDKIQANILEACTITIKRILWDDTYASDKEVTLFFGFADIEFDRQNLVLNCRPIEDSLNVKIPRHTFQEPCNHALFDVNCGLTQSDYAYSSTVESGTNTTLIDNIRGDVDKCAFDNGDVDNPIEIGDTLLGTISGDTAVCIDIVYLTASTGFMWCTEHVGSGALFQDGEVITGGGNQITVDGAQTTDATFYEQGELEMTGGDNSGQRRPIFSDDGGTVTVLWPFPNTIAIGDTYKIYPGCDKNGVTCNEKFGNTDNFKGFLYVPRVEETIM